MTTQLPTPVRPPTLRMRVRAVLMGSENRSLPTATIIGEVEKDGWWFISDARTQIKIVLRRMEKDNEVVKSYGDFKSKTGRVSTKTKVAVWQLV